MIKSSRALLMGLLFTFSPAFAQSQVDDKAQAVAGNWLGNLKSGAVEVRLAFQISEKDGKYSGTMDSIDQGAKGLKLTEVSLKDGSARFGLKGIVFEGKLNKEATEIVGDWKQGGEAIPMTLKRVDKVPVLSRPQEPKRPFPYREEEVAYENAKAKVKLAGTLTLPKGEGRFPAVLLITGSGAQNRDEEIFGHKPFMVIADFLTRRGIAVLRVDDRGVGGSTGSVPNSTTADFAEDVKVGIEFLKAHKEIDGKKIGLIGHSEGGIIAPLVASQSKDVAFIIMLAGTGMPGDELLLRQNKLVLEGAGADKAAVDAQLKRLSLVFPIVKDEADPKVVEKKALEALAKQHEKSTEEEKKTLAIEEKNLKAIVRQLSAPWFRYFLSYDPQPALRKVQCPVLALNGDKDLQVPCQANLEAIGKALKEGGNKDVTIKELPNLNHLFQTCKTGNPGDYGAIEETLAPAVLEMMAEWILVRVKK